MKKATPANKSLPPGKIPVSLLARLLAKNQILDPRVIVGPGVGEDAAAVQFDGSLVAAATDPVTFATDLIGWYVVHINANDIAVMGARPKWFVCTVLFAEGSAKREVEGVFDQIMAACQSLDIALIGGHAEVTAGLDRNIAVGTMLGEMPESGLVTSRGARPGDRIILTGAVAIEGTSLLAREHGEKLIASGAAPAEIKRAQKLLIDPGISVVKAAALACRAARPHAMHDPTEGGLATGLRELAQASGVGLEVELEAIPTLPACADFCCRLELDPLGLIASGALLVAASPKECDAIMEALKDGGVPAAVIGIIRPAEHGCRITDKGKPRNLPCFERDEIARLYEA